jgi:hypothetical protein
VITGLHSNGTQQATQPIRCGIDLGERLDEA